MCITNYHGEEKGQLNANVNPKYKEGKNVLAYASKALKPAQKNYCTTRKELLAVVDYVCQFRQYLLGIHFVIRTDHISLRWLEYFMEPENQLARWLEKLGE